MASLCYATGLANLRLCLIAEPHVRDRTLRREVTLIPPNGKTDWNVFSAGGAGN